ncbi:MAG: spore coat protein [Candidatus Fimenecus sp.]
MIRFLAFYHKENGKHASRESAPEAAAEIVPQTQKEADTPLSEIEILEDLLASQQQIAELYNAAAADCTAGTLKNDILAILREEHNLHTTVLDELTARGKRKQTLAPQNKIDEVKREFAQQDKA